VAYVAPLSDAGPPSPEVVRRCCAVLRERGYTEAITAALTAPETNAFVAAGFTVRERLHLLAHDLARLDPGPRTAGEPRPAFRLRRARRADRATALAIDARCFDDFWRLDEPGLDEAIGATPASRFRVAEASGRLVGYAVSGRSGSRGFLQRLAVDPSARRRGCATALVVDGLRWMKRRGVDRAMVNTQEQNDAALRLYLDLGFQLQPGGLAVLSATLT